MTWCCIFAAYFLYQSHSIPFWMRLPWTYIGSLVSSLNLTVSSKYIMPPTISIAIVTYHPDISLLNRVLGSLHSSIEMAKEKEIISRCEVFLVDNGSDFCADHNVEVLIKPEIYSQMSTRHKLYVQPCESEISKYLIYLQIYKQTYLTLYTSKTLNVWRIINPPKTP